MSRITERSGTHQQAMHTLVFPKMFFPFQTNPGSLSYIVYLLLHVLSTPPPKKKWRLSSNRYNTGSSEFTLPMVVFACLDNRLIDYIVSFAVHELLSSSEKKGLFLIMAYLSNIISIISIINTIWPTLWNEFDKRKPYLCSLPTPPMVHYLCLCS